MDIYFLRHASAGQHTANPKKDEKRPIDKTGEKQSRDVGRALAALDVQLEVAVSSTLTRAVQTAEIVLAEMGYKEKLVTDDAMRPESGYDQFQQLLSNYADKKAMMVIGHDPSITDFLTQMLVSKGGREFIDFKKGAVAKVETDGERATLKWFLTPKMARALVKGKAGKASSAKKKSADNKS
jgi:phosphohistidine phosphatase